MSLSFLKTLSPEFIWALVGIILTFIEFFIPGLVIAFFGVGALITALTTWMGITTSMGTQLLVFIVSSLLLLLLLRKYLKETFLGQSQEAGSSVSSSIEIGKIVPVIEYIQPGEVGGKVRYQGTNWGASAEESIAPGESVKITGIDNITLIVEKIKK